MSKMIAYCGLVCTDCPAYIATLAFDRGDMDTVQQMVEKSRTDFGDPNITAEGLMCDGCIGDVSAGQTLRQCGYCAECAVRACAVERGVVNCAHCDAYVCDTLSRFFGMAAHARVTLDQIRATL